MMKTWLLGAVVSAGAIVMACGGGNAGGDGAKAPTDAAKTTAESGSGAAGGGPSTVPSGSLAEQEAWAKLNEEMSGYIKHLNSACGTSVSGAYDTASYKGKFKDGESYGVSVYARSSCQNLIQAVADLCGSSEPGKARVKSKIQKIECKYGSAGQKPNISLSGGTLSGQFDPEAGGAVMGSATTDWLKKSL